jgi:hypothetical protein
MSKDHTVPQMYLRRFGRQRKRASREWYIRARHLDNLEHRFEVNVRKVAAVTDFYGDQVERLLCKIESDAMPAMDAMLEDPRGALPGPDRWPLGPEDRASLAWWIAAQIVRTTRQRRRLVHLASQGDGQLPVPSSIKSLAGRGEHVKFITDQLASLSWVIFARPWGLGFSDVCLWTSDVPVIVVNGQDHENQLLATSYWDVILPLDPHRFLILPGWGTRQEDPRKQVDHCLKLPGGLGLALSRMVFDAADSQVFCDAEHDPFPHLRRDLDDGPRLPTPWTGEEGEGPSYLLSYATMNPGWTVERRWLTEHAPPRATA